MAGERSHRHTRSVIPDLRRLHSPDIPDIKVSRPDNEDNFCLLVQAMIGPKGATGEESFSFVVCTPNWLQQSLANGREYVFGRSYLVVGQYNFDTIWDAIESLCQRISGESWEEVADKLSRYAHWEYEDYRES